METIDDRKTKKNTQIPRGKKDRIGRREAEGMREKYGKREAKGERERDK